MLPYQGGWTEPLSQSLVSRDSLLQSTVFYRFHSPRCEANSAWLRWRGRFGITSRNTMSDKRTDVNHMSWLKFKYVQSTCSGCPFKGTRGWDARTELIQCYLNSVVETCLNQCCKSPSLAGGNYGNGGWEGRLDTLSDRNS